MLRLAANKQWLKTLQVLGHCCFIDLAHKFRIVVSHPFRKKHEKDGARCVFL